ncbi:MAG: sialate O-acetylesterase [Candidatus Marinimicrobia bacterium]|nr:sialate O-acetylesterase [Candidatus Neomarinimicrobiota bacterium]
MKRSFLRFIILAAATLHLSAVPTADSLSVYGRVLCDSTGLVGVEIGDTRTDSSGYFHVMIPAGVDTVLTPSYRAFTFSPAFFEISASDTSVDSLIFVAQRVPKKVIVIAGQSNAENVGEPRYFIPDTVDDHIPYYLAYCHGEFGLSTLGLLTKFGQSESFIQGYNRGFGVEILLARTLYKNYTDSLGVMKIAYSGTTLNEDWQVDGRTYPRFTSKHDNAVELFRNKGYDPRYIGFFWFQGVGDRTADRAPLYAENLDEFITRIRDRFPNDSAVDSLPFVCVRTKWRETSYENMVRAAQMGMGEHRGHYAGVDIDDCDDLRYSETNNHFNGDALNRIGYKLALAYLDLVGEPVDSNITIRTGFEGTKDSTLTVQVGGDTSFTQGITTGGEIEFAARIGKSYTLQSEQAEGSYNITPARHYIPFAYGRSALYMPVYTFTIEEAVGVRDPGPPSGHRLLEIIPNPFNPVTTIQYEIPESRHVRIRVFDMAGRMVVTLTDDYKKAGRGEIVWNAGGLSSGIYIYRLEAGDFQESRKMLLLK